MAAVICSTIIFLEAAPIPGASIRQTGTTSSFMFRTPTFSNSGATLGALRYAISDDENQMPVHRVTARILPVGASTCTSFDMDGSRTERSRQRSLVAITRPPKSWVKMVGFTIVRVSDPGGQISGLGGQFAFAVDAARLARAREL